MTDGRTYPYSHHFLAFSKILYLKSPEQEMIAAAAAAAAGNVGQPLLSAVIEKLFERLASSELLKFARRAKLQSELKKCGMILLKIQALLDDADQRQMSDRSVNVWLAELRDLAYDLEDILDEFATETLRRRLMAQESQNKVWILLCPSWFRGFILNVNLGSKIRHIYARLQDVVTQKDNLNLREIVAVPGRERGNLLKERMRSTSLVDESCVYGRESDKAEILELLLKNEDFPSGDKICVISIMGMGGIGKTALAQLVYNDDLVSECFDFKVWVCVSEEFDVVRVTKTILQAITFETYDESDLNLLQLKLKEKLSGKRFLLVLDDVWNEDYELWDILRRPFKAGDNRSKIIVTTRNEGVALIIGTVASYRLKVLSDEDCFSLLTQHALGTRNFSERSDLKAVGEKIARKCKGLPLAAKVIGGLLRTKLDRNEWEIVLKSNVWDFPGESGGIIPPLRLSYYHLPSHLKQLFVYCAIFPKDYEFDKDELILLWMAEGFLPHQGGKRLVEDVGSCYFNELLARSFFERSRSKDSRYVMHDLINDLAKYVAENICCNLDDKFGNDDFDTILQKTRHVTFTRHTYEVSQRFKDFFRMKSLRTLIALPIYLSSWAAFCYINNIIFHDFFPGLRCLRSLSLSGYCIMELPDSIGDLKLLRYLNMSRTKIVSLPESVGNLVNLQTLLLRGCTELTKLPRGINNLINLCYLDIRDTNSLKEMPPGICNLTSLRLLPKFIVGKNNQLRLRELKNLSHLREELSIYGLHNVVDIVDARIANLRDKHGLLELAMEWSDNFNDSHNKQDEMSTLNFLKPSRSLQKLRISHYGGAEFASWIGDPSFTNIISISLYNCRKSRSLPSLGRLPLLRDLHIEGMDEIKTVDFWINLEDSVKRFPSLETLLFKNMLEWEYWCFPSGINEEIFPRLHHLLLHNCPKLIEKLPNQIPSLVKLTISQCPKLQYSPTALPSLLELNIENCINVTCQQDGCVCSHVAPKPVTVSNRSELTSFWKAGAEPQNIVSIEENGCFQLASNCGKLGKLLCQLHSVTCLKVLRIKSCPKLESFPKADFVPMLRHLLLRDCPDLKALPEEMMILSCNSKSLLEELEIEECPSLKCFPKGKLPTTLKRLKIHYCTNLQSLPEVHIQIGCSNRMLQLENLEIVGCPSLNHSMALKY